MKLQIGIFLIFFTQLVSNEIPVKLSSPNLKIQAQIKSNQLIIEKSGKSTWFTLDLMGKFALSNEFSYGDDIFIMLATVTQPMVYTIYTLLNLNDFYILNHNHISQDRIYLKNPDSLYNFDTIHRYYFNNDNTLIVEFLDPKTQQLFSSTVYTMQDFMNNQKCVQDKKRQKN